VRLWSPGAGQPAVDERREARAFELAESNCVSRGKDVEAGRVEGQTVDLAARLVGWFDEHLKG